jgi:hypothetical protein
MLHVSAMIIMNGGGSVRSLCFQQYALRKLLTFSSPARRLINKHMILSNFNLCNLF